MKREEGRTGNRTKGRRKGRKEEKDSDGDDRKYNINEMKIDELKESE